MKNNFKNFIPLIITLLSLISLPVFATPQNIEITLAENTISFSENTQIEISFTTSSESNISETDVTNVKNETKQRIKNAVKEPKIMPIRLYNIAFVAPNKATPAKVLTTLGIGKTMTCKYCNTTYSIGIHAPDFSKYSCRESVFLITLKKPVFCNINRLLRVVTQLGYFCCILQVFNRNNLWHIGTSI